MNQFNKGVGSMIDKADFDKKKSNWKKTGIETQSSFFGADIINTLLNKPGCIGISINYGMNDEGQMQPILTAELESSTVSTEPTSYANASLPCPPVCRP